MLDVFHVEDMTPMVFGKYGWYSKKSSQRERYRRLS